MFAMFRKVRRSPLQSVQASIVRKLLLFVSISFHIALLSKEAMAISIFEVRRRLAMVNGEVTEKDFYLNGGKEKGLKPGMIVTVTRQVALYDSYQNKSPGDLNIPVGELKVMFVQKGVTVAREHSMFDRKNLPILEDNFLMVGDQVDMGSARMDSGDRAPAADLGGKTKRVSSVSVQTDLEKKMAAGMEPAEPDSSSQQESPSSQPLDVSNRQLP